MTYSFSVVKSFHRQGFDLRVLQYDNYDGVKISTKRMLTENGWVECPEGGVVLSLPMNTEDLISLADELWRNKIKPPEFFNSVGEQDATKKHLEDMRQIAFNKLNLEKPK